MSIDTEKYIIIFAFQELNTINNLFMLMSGLNSVCYVSRKGVNINKKTQEIIFLFRVRFYHSAAAKVEVHPSAI